MLPPRKIPTVEKIKYKSDCSANARLSIPRPKTRTTEAENLKSND
jgi:hypothetical protein